MSVIAQLSMFVNIQTFVLDAGRNAKPMEFLDAIEEGDAAGCSPEVDDEDTKALGSEKAPAMSIEGAISGGEQTGHECAENTTDTVYRACTHRIVDVEHVVDELNGEDQDSATHETDDDCAHW